MCLFVAIPVLALYAAGLFGVSLAATLGLARVLLWALGLALTAIGAAVRDVVLEGAVADLSAPAPR